MPRGDGTGPMGMGPMTGRVAGYCAGYGMPGYTNPVYGRGLWGHGLGFGGYPSYASWGYPTSVPYCPWIRRGFIRGRCPGRRRGCGRGRW